MQQDPKRHTLRSILAARIPLWLACALLLVLGPASTGRAQEESAPAAEWEITADQIIYNSNTDTYAAQGNVRVAMLGRVITADMMRLDQRSRQAWAEGNVHLFYGEDRLSGQALQLDLDKETGSLTDGSLFVAANHMYVKGQLILKTGPQSYQAFDASVTTCDGPEPDWHITTKDLEVTLEGYGFAKHAAFWADGVPLMYLPYMIFPVKLKRQSGLLAPEFGISDRAGAEYLQPFFWAINDSMDATFYAHGMTERGMRIGAEYRYVAGGRSLGVFMGDWLDDQRIDNGLDDNSNRWGYTGDPYLRTNRERFWVRGKADQDLPLGATAKLDLDVVSDQDYLQDFRGSINGFDESQKVFLRTFGRDIDDFTNPFRKDQLNLNRLWSTYTVNGNLRWYQDAVQDRPAGSLGPVQSLPELSLDGIKQKIGGTPIYYNLASDYSYLYVENGYRGHRADLYPRLYYPYRFGNAFSIEPSAGFRQTVWYVDRYPGAPSDEGRDHYRSLADFRLDGSTELSRVYSTETAGWDRLMHSIQPQLVYQYMPGQDQNQLPLFDELDRMPEQHLVTFVLSQWLIARKPAPAQTPSAEPFYLPFLRFRLEESFDIKRYQDDDPRPFSDVFGEIDLFPAQYVRLESDFRWRPYDGEFYGFNMALMLWDLRGDRLSLEYRSNRATDVLLRSTDDMLSATDHLLPVQSLNATALWQVTSRWQLGGKYEYDLDRQQLLESGVGIGYRAQCWGVDVNYRIDSQHNSSFAFRVHLTGLGSLGR